MPVATAHCATNAITHAAVAILEATSLLVRLQGRTLAHDKKLRHFVALTSLRAFRAMPFCVVYSSLTTPMTMFKRNTENTVTAA
mmetsp:Transcript_67142/g.180379  ORF Transcript_67142/g.180379 Transcript_67142/m.180379 type:complete len:84 (-) Transcript_67142:1159-1410(-)